MERGEKEELPHEHSNPEFFPINSVMTCIGVG